MTDACAHLDEYRILRKIGTGYSADVFEAELNDRRFAVKIFKEETYDFAENEFQMGNKLLHPFIIEYEEHRKEAAFNSTQGRTCRQAIVMELAAKGQIFDLVEHCGGFSEVVARTYFHMLVDALEYIHDCGLVHLDIKAQNLLLDENYLLKVSDFGFSQQRGQMIHRKVGTEGYMSPQIQFNEGFFGEDADIFAAGVVLFIMVTGFQPFKSTKENDIYYRTLNGNPSRFWNTYKNKSLSTSFKDLIQRMLSDDQGMRLSISEIRQHPWFCGDILLNRDLTDTVYKLRGRK